MPSHHNTLEPFRQSVLLDFCVLIRQIKLTSSVRALKIPTVYIGFIEMIAITFDTHNAVKRLMTQGVPEPQAEEFVKIFSEIKETNMRKIASKKQVTVIEKDVENIIQNVATKVELENVRTEVEKVRTEFRTELHKTETKLEDKIHRTEVRLMLMIGASIVATCSIILGVLGYMLQILF
jgi:hypothetical protein